MDDNFEDIGQSILNSSTDFSIEGLLDEEFSNTNTSSEGDQISLPLTKIIPNRYNPKQLIPLELKTRFYGGEIDCFETIREVIILAKNNPFLENELANLQELGQSIIFQGQVDPAMGNWNDNRINVDKNFILDSGNRRYWACVLNYVNKKTRKIPNLIVLESNPQDTKRNMVSTRYQKDLTDVEIALLIASIILHEEEVDLESDKNTISNFDHFRLVHKKKRYSKATWNILKKTFNYSKIEIKNYLKLLSLPDEYLYSAAIWNISINIMLELTLLPDTERKQVFEILVQKAILIKSETLNKNNDKGQKIENVTRSEIISQMANFIESWYEMVNENISDGQFIELSKELSSRFEDSSEFYELSRRLLNLSRDVRVIYTRRRQY